jgi:hypothetical protein
VWYPLPNDDGRAKECSNIALWKEHREDTNPQKIQAWLAQYEQVANRSHCMKSYWRGALSFALSRLNLHPLIASA